MVRAKTGSATVDAVADLEYEGVIYVRPVGRGVSLVDRGWLDLADAVEVAVDARYGVGSGWRGQARIVVELGETVEDDPASASPRS